MELSDTLPPEIRQQADRLMVDRHGRTPDAFMVTDAITGHVEPGTGYRIENTDLVGRAAARSWAYPEIVPTTEAPPYARLTGNWDGGSGGDVTLGNIFGGVGTLTLDREEVEIPAIVATPQALGYYRASLLRPEEVFAFEVDTNLPVTITSFGRDYVDGFLNVPELGGGSYIEFHDLPHLHMPLDQDAAGYMLLGRKEGDDYLLTAFRIPFGCALYTAPEVLHADGYLTGRYMVVYGMTRNYSNVVFRTRDQDLPKVSLVRSV